MIANKIMSRSNVSLQIVCMAFLQIFKITLQEKKRNKNQNTKVKMKKKRKKFVWNYIWCQIFFTRFSLTHLPDENSDQITVYIIFLKSKMLRVTNHRRPNVVKVKSKDYSRRYKISLLINVNQQQTYKT